MKNISKKTILITLTTAILCLPSAGTEKSPVSPLPDGFVYVEAVIPSVVAEMRYNGIDNFVGKQIT